MNCVVFNHDGSIKNLYLQDIIVQGNNNVDDIYCAIEGYSNDAYTAGAIFTLPNLDHSAITGVTASFTVDGSAYQGFKITLTAEETAFAGILKMSLSLTGQSLERAFSVNVNLTINQSGYIPDYTNITMSQYENMIATLATLQPKYVLNNVRFYDGLESAEEDLENLAYNQLIVVADTAHPQQNPKIYFKNTGGTLTYLSTIGNGIVMPVGEFPLFSDEMAIIAENKGIVLYDNVTSLYYRLEDESSTYYNFTSFSTNGTSQSHPVIPNLLRITKADGTITRAKLQYLGYYYVDLNSDSGTFNLEDALKNIPNAFVFTRNNVKMYYVRSSGSYRIYESDVIKEEDANGYKSIYYYSVSLYESGGDNHYSYNVEKVYLLYEIALQHGSSPTTPSGEITDEVANIIANYPQAVKAMWKGSYPYVWLPFEHEYSGAPGSRYLVFSKTYYSGNYPKRVQIVFDVNSSTKTWSYTYNSIAGEWLQFPLPYPPEVNIGNFESDLNSTFSTTAYQAAKLKLEWALLNPRIIGGTIYVSVDSTSSTFTGTSGLAMVKKEITDFMTRIAEKNGSAVSTYSPQKVEIQQEPTAINPVKYLELRKETENDTTKYYIQMYIDKSVSLDYPTVNQLSVSFTFVLI